METPLIIAVASGCGVLFLCIVILIGFMCYRRYKNKNEGDNNAEAPEIQVENFQTDNVIMTRKERTEDIFTGKKAPFGVHNSMNNIPDAIEKEIQDEEASPRGFKPKFQSSHLSVRSIHSVHSTTSSAPSFSEHAVNGNSSMYY